MNDEGKNGKGHALGNVTTVGLGGREPDPLNESRAATSPQKPTGFSNWIEENQLGSPARGRRASQPEVEASGVAAEGSRGSHVPLAKPVRLALPARRQPVVEEKRHVVVDHSAHPEVRGKPTEVLPRRPAAAPRDVWWKLTLVVYGACLGVTIWIVFMLVTRESLEPAPRDGARVRPSSEPALSAPPPARSAAAAETPLAAGAPQSINAAASAEPASAAARAPETPVHPSKRGATRRPVPRASELERGVD